MKIQFVFLDIDGTLVHKRQLVPSAYDAVRRIQERGIGVALCTGRSVLQTIELQQRLNITHAVYFNGGLAVADAQVIAQYPLQPDVVARARTFFVERQLPVVFHRLEESVTPSPLPAKLHSLLQAYDYPATRVEETPESIDKDDDVYQANAFMTEDMDEEVSQRFPECLVYRWHTEATDLQRAGNDKSIGAIALLNYFGLAPEHAVHFGDAGNDIGMFRALGTSVVMGNATEEIKQYADYETSTADQDGVQNGLKHLGLI